MEPMMISLKVLSTAAVMAMVLPLLAPSASFAQDPHGSKANFAGRGAGGGAPAARFSGGGVPAARFSGGGAPVAQFRGGGGGGGYRGGYGGGGYRRGGGGFIPGAIAGAVIGGAIASQSYGYYGAPGYYAPGYPGYYDDQYYDEGVVAVAPAPVGGDDAVAYCMQTYRSYDPASGTYLGYDGLRHPCP
jgi:hypothetical protein